jgi:uncharacterized protein involved in type VI secretion and phage assembly
MDEGNGIMIGLVDKRADLDDPEHLRRVRVIFPTLDDTKSHWARVVAPMGGKDRGFHMIPEVGDEVLCALEEGDPRRVYILGSLWSKEDLPPPTRGDPRENHCRFIRSRCGHVLMFDDTPGDEKVELIDKDEVTKGIKRKIIIDPVKKKITVLSDEGDVEVIVKQGNVKVEAKAGDVSVDATNITLKASGSIKLEAPTIELKASGSATVEATTTTVKGSATTTIQGGLVKIN